ncbi:ubiquitin thioesteras-like protein OTU1 [Dothidotthia symphoricarpi CBS 119687]|uniref:Ubiquitin thioesterase OTU n=1 Tax=Dothidotthia symphoricarpi CBS 119687 TaxID=1392245 RepID=A0A6A6AFS6_9PLEO|nr:ubiquitin thioesteras-like protein OTU1 [Dothidotthia symphoricarpi CBS 119687]KAF2130153.1 ubiquitin thioesteras-like protein OTU1 [Dothidotthia symphoricarpi CBS 119687]
MPIRIRLRAPNGQHTLSLEDNAAVSDLLSSISTSTDLPLFELKWGFPPQPLDPALYGLSTLLKDTDLKLNGAQIIVIGQATGDPSEKKQEEEQSKSAPLSLQRKQASALKDKDTPEIPVPDRGGTVVLRVMPDDNSCMFRAVGSAVLTDTLDSMTELRSLVAQAIQRDPDFYNEAVLQKAPDEYCKWISYSDSWGGGIELSILSQEFDIEIASVNVQDLRVDRFNEGKAKRCILVYSGIHYDTIAFVPAGSSTFDPDNDVKLFDARDDVMLEAARQLCGELKKAHYFTDTQKFDIKCNTCGWKGAGERGAVKHANETGHTDFGEAN